MTEFVLYVRRDCHLCEAFLQEMAGFFQQKPYQLNVIDITANEQLESEYGTRIPVLLAADTEICQYFFDAEAITKYFESQ